MKKIISLILVFIMALGLTTAAFAESATLKGVGDQNVEVTASYMPAKETPQYNVDITWTNMTFTYTESGTKTWNADKHTYSEVTGAWDKTSSTVTVTNHSNVPVDVVMHFDGQTANTGIEAKFTGGNATLAAGVEGKPEEAETVTGELTIADKKPNSSLADTSVTIGTITVTISAAAE